MDAGGLAENGERPDRLGSIIGTAIGCGIVLVTVLGQLLVSGEAILVGLTVLGPLAASLRATARQTAGVALLAVLVALELGRFTEGYYLSADHFVRLGVIVSGGSLSIYAAAQREERLGALRRLSHVAELAQEVMLRPPPALLGGIALAARYVSASADSRIGGDLYETAYTASGVRVIVGDARGKGLDGIKLAATVLAAFREEVWDGDLASVVRALDARVVQEAASDEDFVTALMVEFPPEGGIRLINCGHHPPIRLHGDGAEPLVPAEPTTPLGLAPEPTVERYPLQVGDRLLLYTDGLVEARDSRGVFFPLAAHLTAVRAGDLQQAVDALVTAVTEHLPGELSDDLALLLAERRA